MFARANKAGEMLSGKPGKKGAGLSFIDSEVVVSGDLVSAAQIHIDGRVEGDVRCVTLCQGQTGTIVGNIVAEQARLAGLVDGGVAARNLILEPSARITGDVTYETLTIAAGAQIEGRLARREGPAEASPKMAAARTPRLAALEPTELFVSPAVPRAAAL